MSNLTSGRMTSMARREDYEHWSMGLPMASEALQDLDTVCGELGLTRGEVSRLIVITWSKARRGTVQHLWGFPSSVVVAAGSHGNGIVGAEIGEASQVVAPVPTRRQQVVSETAAAAVQGLQLELDDEADTQTEQEGNGHEQKTTVDRKKSP